MYTLASSSLSTSVSSSAHLTDGCKVPPRTKSGLEPALNARAAAWVKIEVAIFSFADNDIVEGNSLHAR